MPNRSISPEILPIDDITLQKPQKHRLSNGVPFFLIPNDQLDLIHLIVRVKTGILYEHQKHLSLFTYALLKESSKDYTANEIADLLAFNGTYYSVSQSLERINLSISAPKDKIGTILPIISDFILHPKFKEENLALYKKIRIKDLEYNEQKTEFRATQLMLHAMFGDGHTAGQFSTKENLCAITIGQMDAFHQASFVAENVSIFATGNIDYPLQRLIFKLFEQIPYRQASTVLPHIDMPFDHAPVIKGTISTAIQSTICLAMPHIGYQDQDKRDFSVLSTILGGYFGSRLMQRLREKEGYTYGISCGSVYFGGQSLFMMDSNVNAKDTNAAIEACFEEMQILQDKRVSFEELESARNYIIGDMLRDVENSVSYMKQFAFWNLHGFDETEFQTQISHIRSITPDRIQQLAKDYLSRNKFTLVIVNSGDVF